MDLSIIIPACNEEGRIAGTLSRIVDFFLSRQEDFEVIVVDDGSKDGTAGVAEAALNNKCLGTKCRFKVIRESRNQGKGWAVKKGVVASSGRLVLFTDADLSTDIAMYERFLPYFDQGFEVVIGSRALKESWIKRRQPRVRELLGKTFNLAVRWLVIRGYKDTQCGFKMFSRKAADHIFPLLVTRGFAFDVEILWLCRQLDFMVKEVPVVWENSIPSRVGLVSGSFSMLNELMRLWFRRLRSSSCRRKLKKSKS